MDRLRKLRGSHRASITRIANLADVKLAKEEPNFVELKVFLRKLESLRDQVEELDQQVREGLLDADSTPEELQEEEVCIEEYSFKATRSIIAIVNFTTPTIRSSGTSESAFTSAMSETGSERKRMYKLPKIEIKKFNGELTEWLSFWSQFKKIDGDEDLHDSDKLQYLVQSMVPGTRGCDLVNRYPQTGENYPKVVSALKERFGDKKLLGDVYARELLRMAIYGASTKDKTSLSTLYDKLETNLHALESIDISTEGPHILLLPMVESSLPEDVLRAWQRSPLSSEDGSTQTPKKTSLDFLMEFLRKEVRNEERIELARKGFELVGEKKMKKTSGEVSGIGQLNSSRRGLDTAREDVPTIAGLHMGAAWVCILCDKSNHSGQECYKAREMTYEEKKARIRKKSGCIICVRGGHTDETCKIKISCGLCDGKHHELMCPKFPIKKVAETKSVLTNIVCDSDVYLPTLMVQIGNGKNKRTVRALLDSGSMRSYVLKQTAAELDLRPLSQEVIDHDLFGGVSGGQKTHQKYELFLHGKNHRDHRLTVLDSPKICSTLPRVKRGSWLEQLKKLNINLNDLCDGSKEDPKIELLIGADYYGTIITGNMHRLWNGLTAIETEFGWTVMGKISNRMKKKLAVNEKQEKIERQERRDQGDLSSDEDSPPVVGSTMMTSLTSKGGWGFPPSNWWEHQYGWRGD